MSEPAPETRPGRTHFSLAPFLRARAGILGAALAPLLDRLLALTDLNATYGRIPHDLDPISFAGNTLDQVGVDVTIDQASLAHIPASGPCIVVANHPHGAIDGVGLIHALGNHRRDIKVMANHLLENFHELREVFIGVDPFGGSSARQFNIRAVRQALTWLRQGGMLVMFPGGEVSSFDWRTRRVADPPWDSGIGWLVEKSGAMVVPMFISGRNSALFQCLGLLHPALRTALLVREMHNHRGTVIALSSAPPITAETLNLLGDRKSIAPYLRASTDLIRARSQYRKPMRLGSMSQPAPNPVEVAEPMDKSLLAGEIAALPAGQRLVDNNGRMETWYAYADQIPWLLQEIGRLRELSFRQVGEGTGKATDLDLYDSYYIHLFVWDKQESAVVGGYRLGEADSILRRYGSKGLYVRSLFKLSPQLEDELRIALEVGRSFVRPEFQRDYASLMMLWKGIGAYVARYPRYRILFGPVSISNDYHPVSQRLIVRFLKKNSMELERASQVKPHHPFRDAATRARRVDLDVSDLRIIANLLSTVEDDRVGIPVLLRQYLKLNGRILGFNVDPEFNNAIDCLLWVDLARTEPALLGKYMGAQGAQRFLTHHQRNRDLTGA